MFKHRIALTLRDLRHDNSTPYRAGLKASEFEKTEIDKMLCMNVFMPAP